MPAGSRITKASPWPSIPPIANPPSQSSEAFFKILGISKASSIKGDASIFETFCFFKFL